MTEHLEPCPFLHEGHELEILTGGGYRQIGCRICAAVGPVRITAAEARAAWNSRAPAAEGAPVFVMGAGAEVGANSRALLPSAPRPLPNVEDIAQALHRYFMSEDPWNYASGPMDGLVLDGVYNMRDAARAVHRLIGGEDA